MRENEELIKNKKNSIFNNIKDFIKGKVMKKNDFYDEPEYISYDYSIEEITKLQKEYESGNLDISTLNIFQIMDLEKLYNKQIKENMKKINALETKKEKYRKQITAEMEELKNKQ